MHNRDLDKSSMMDDRMRNREDIDRDMFEESNEDLQRKQSEGNLGNERVRGGARSSGDDMRGTGDE
jgi:hypothetical protein